MKTLRLKKEILSPLNESLSRLKLDIKESSARRRFLRAIKDVVVDKEETVNELNKKYAKKDPDGEPKIITTESPIQPGIKIQSYSYTKENAITLDKEVSELLQEWVSVDVTPSFEQDLPAIISILDKEAKRFAEEKKETMSAKDFEYYNIFIDAIEMLSNIKE